MMRRAEQYMFGGSSLTNVYRGEETDRPFLPTWSKFASSLDFLIQALRPKLEGTLLITKIPSKRNISFGPDG